MGNANPVEARVSAAGVGSHIRGLGVTKALGTGVVGPRTAGLANATEAGPGEKTLLVLGVISTTLGLRDKEAAEAVLPEELPLDPVRVGPAPGNAPTTPDVKETTAADFATLLVVTCSRIGSQGIAIGSAGFTL